MMIRLEGDRRMAVRFLWDYDGISYRSNLKGCFQGISETVDGIALLCLFDVGIGLTGLLVYVCRRERESGKTVFITSENTEQSHQRACKQRLPIMQQCFLFRSEIMCVIAWWSVGDPCYGFICYWGLSVLQSE